MAHVDFIPTFQKCKELRAFGYTGHVQLDKVLRWFREKENIHINPVITEAGYEVRVTVKYPALVFVDMGIRKYEDYYGAAWAGIERAKFYINNAHRTDKTKANINVYTTAL